MQELTDKLEVQYGLTKKQSEHWIQYAACGNLEQACRETGYNINTARKEIRTKPAVQAAVAEIAQSMFAVDLVKARAVLIRLLDSDNEKVAFQAAQYLIERGAGKVPDTALHLHAHAAIPDKSQLRDRIVNLADELKLTDKLPQDLKSEVEVD